MCVFPSDVVQLLLGKVQSEVLKLTGEMQVLNIRNLNAQGG
jgi:hypothetical protein